MADCYRAQADRRLTGTARAGWVAVERKSRFIDQIMRGTLDVREIDDIGDNTLAFAKTKDITSGNPLILEEAKADQELTRLESTSGA